MIKLSVYLIRIYTGSVLSINILQGKLTLIYSLKKYLLIGIFCKPHKTKKMLLHLKEGYQVKYLWGNTEKLLLFY